MLAAIHFDFPFAWQAGLPLALTVLALAAWRQNRRGVRSQHVASLTALRGIPLLALLFLAARPAWVAKEPPSRR